MTMALVHYGYGDLGTADIRYEAVASPIAGPADVVVEVLESPINPSDINVIEGKYVFQPRLPAVLGREGVGRVVTTGERVISMAAHHLHGFWCSKTVAPGTEWWVVPDPIPTEVAAHLSINGLTAYLLLTEFVVLHPGDTVVQTAPNSSVGRWISYFAEQMHLRCVSIDRDGGALDMPGIKLGLNSVGGASVAALSKTVVAGGTIVTYGAMSKESPHISNSALIFKEQIFRGFLRSAWVARHGLQITASRLNDIAFILMKTPFPTVPRTVFALADYRSAFAHVASGKPGKAVFGF
jgi:NADPH:quinone reductase-like Zn-dependent oxidoreductase